MRARLYATLATIGLGFGVLVVAAVNTQAHVTTVAIFASVAILAELLQWSSDDFTTSGTDERPFTLAVPVQIAAAVVVGPWAAALVAGIAVLAVRRLHGSSWPAICLRASLAATAGLAAGFAYELAGGHVGDPALPADLIPVLALGLVYFGAYALLLTAALPWNGIETDPVIAIGETALGLLLGIFAARQAWNLLALAPVGLLVEQAHARLLTTRREVASALETFATIVDERDPSTYGHSARVARYVAELAEALGMPPAEVARLKWAGRLHDLGKVAVDAAVLRKPDRLDDSEWASVRRAPRLSARLLHRFRFAAKQARAVEYQHERFDGTGYYGVRGDELPLASHFLIVADSFDAMTTDRAFRQRLSKEAALEEIERNSGTQFHPTISKAFVALQRGQSIDDVLAPEELAALRESTLSYRLAEIPRLRDLRERPELVGVGGVALALLGAGTGHLGLLAFGGASAVLGLLLHGLRQLRSRRLVEELRRASAASEDRIGLFEWIVAALAKTTKVDWAGLVACYEHGLGGVIELQQGEKRPDEQALLSWLIREAQIDQVVIAAGPELGGEGAALALPLRLENSALVGFLIFFLPRRPPAFVEAALATCVDELGLGFAERPIVATQGYVQPRTIASVASVDDASRLTAS
jgi:HD-GYP domain-containing protein (c-di-GMP phosphodiesterase class II)